MIQLQYVIKEATTVKAFLLNQNYSKKSLSAIKQNGALLVNDWPVTVREPLKTGDVLEVTLPDEVKSPNLKPSNLQVEVLFEDCMLIIVNKPSYMNTIPSQLHPHDSLIEAVYGYMERNTNDRSVLHPVSRLDRNTSGIVVFAKHQLFHHLLTNKIEKNYLLLCVGEVKYSGNVCMPIDRAQDSIITRTVSVSGKSARTEYSCLLYDADRDISLVKVKLHTGRTHQIRVHFQAIGHPLIGDTLYGEDCQLNRHALHANQVTFKQPLTNDMINIELPIPEDFSHIFDVL
ncbi:RluA family pseudouridine synthase [Macrococcus animalis]|uniref:RluA family pseudouridine synthase n=1 Tax=Macrococcus animalis TaxID=3395467 RepID=UPI0039BE8CBA